jgi:predicted kinase
MHTLKILRGVSGSGKSTRAKELCKEVLGQGKQAVTCSADEFFVDPATGDYNFDSRKLGEAHAWCRGNAHMAMRLGVDLVVIDNTNTRRWEYEGYIKMAADAGYEVSEEIVGQFDESNLKAYANRNKHGVPLDAIRKMAQRFEK